MSLSESCYAGMTATGETDEERERLGVGRVLRHVTIQTGRRDDVTKGKRSTAQVDPYLTMASASFVDGY
jgi:hypothetical protein